MSLRHTCLLLLLLLLFSCNVNTPTPNTPKPIRTYELRAESRAALAQEPAMLSELEAVLIDYFGEPEVPHVQGLAENLGEGGALFRRSCSRCHGFEGGGNGPMSDRLSPKPRNYHTGVFKYAATLDTPKPRRADLLRTLLHGLPGTAMPSFRHLSKAKLEALIGYVCLLSMRGEMESLLVDEWLDEGTPPAEAAEEIFELVREYWMEAETRGVTVVPPAPDSDPSRLKLGHDVFMDESRGNCYSCHGEGGKGDGIKALRVDNDGRSFALLKDDWGQYILPRDFGEGMFRGGARREDIFIRMHCGIPGTPMPSLGLSRRAGGAPLLSDEEAWAVVDYVLSLSNQGPLANSE